VFGLSRTRTGAIAAAGLAALLAASAVSLGLDSDSSLAKKPKATYQCGDGIDNDGDGFTDYPDDPQCIAVYD